MKLCTGHLNLFDVYRFVAAHPAFVSGKNGDMGEYTKLVNKIVESIPNNTPGWYLWGNFNDTGFWHTVYLGKAGNKKTSSLRARIKEELLDERAAFWATVYGSEPTERQFQKIFKNKYGPGTRSYRKRNPAINIQSGSYPAPTRHTDGVVRAVDSEIASITLR